MTPPTVIDDPAPRGAIPNWQPATTFEDYLRNCSEGLEEYSDRRAARLLGWSRIHVFRARLMAEIPEDLFGRLLQADVRSAKALAAVSQALRRGNTADVERCPHCGGVVRIRQAVGEKARNVVNAWLSEQGGER